MYIAPIIEWFLPTLVNRPIHDLAKRSKIESFQFRMLCLVTGASQRVSAAGLFDICAELPVTLKLRKFCAGFVKHVDRDPDALRTGTCSAPRNRSTRSGNRLGATLGRGPINTTLETAFWCYPRNTRAAPKRLSENMTPTQSTEQPLNRSTSRTGLKSPMRRLGHRDKR